jgi:hypothetical protein
MFRKLILLGTFFSTLTAGLSVGAPGAGSSTRVGQHSRTTDFRAAPRTVPAAPCVWSLWIEEFPLFDPPPDLLLPKRERVSDNSWHYRGVVMAVGVDWLELGAGWTGSVEIDPTGRQIVRRNGDDKKPKRISAVGTRPGGNPRGEGEPETHRVSDLKVGDIVSIDTHAARDGEEWTTQIWIQRRPGGKIPPHFGDPLAGTIDATHLRDQAEQDWEEKGVPIPRRYLNPQGRAPWTNPPYPPVAPQPRPAPARP